MDNAKTSIDIDCLGKRIAYLRRLSGISVPLLVDRANVGAAERPILRESTIRNLESGRKRDITVTELIGLARGLDMPATMILSDPLRPFDTSFAEPFRSLEMSNFEVSMMLPFPDGTPENGMGTVSSTSRGLVHACVQAWRIVCDMDGAVRESRVLCDRYLRDLRIVKQAVDSIDAPEERPAMTVARRRQYRDELNDTKEYVDLVYAIRGRNTWKRFNAGGNALTALQEMNNVPAASNRDMVRAWPDDSFDWLSKIKLDADERDPDESIALLLLNTGRSVYPDVGDTHDDAPRILRILAETYVEKGLSSRLGNDTSSLSVFRESTKARREGLRLYFMASCFLADAEASSSIMSRIDLDSLNAVFGSIIALYRLMPFGTQSC